MHVDMLLCYKRLWASPTWWIAHLFWGGDRWPLNFGVLLVRKAFVLLLVSLSSCKIVVQFVFKFDSKSKECNLEPYQPSLKWCLILLLVLFTTFWTFLFPIFFITFHLENKWDNQQLMLQQWKLHWASLAWR